MDINAVRRLAENIRKAENNSIGRFLVTKVAGVTFNNRQDLIKVLRMDSKLRILRDRSNQHDFFACKIQALIGTAWFDIGFVPKEVNKEIAEELDRFVEFAVTIESKTDSDPIGLIVKIERK